jgi:hypothetical protein
MGGSIYIVPKGQELTEAHDTWINSVLMPVWRVRADEIEKARRKFEESQWWEFSMANGTNPNVVPAKWPKDKLEEFHKVADEYMKTDAYRRPLADAPPVMPPRVPDDLAVWLSTKDGFVPVDPKAVRDLPVPEDPILTRHKAYWGRIFAAVEILLGTSIPDRTEIPNQYWDDPNHIEPWYTFLWHGYKVVVGPRKRVNVVEMVGPPVEVLNYVTRMGKRDETTYSAGGGSALIHAWGDVKTVEYLVEMLREG